MKTSWENVNVWYKNNVREKGHYYHQNVIIPNSLRLLNLRKTDVILDLACGQGVFSRSMPQVEGYTGLDISPSLIDYAKKLNKSDKNEFVVADITKPLPISKSDYSHACIILALQNIKNLTLVFKNAFEHLGKGGLFLIVLNHPAFRIPQNSGWGIDKEKNSQYRRIDNYLTPQEIPIYANPSKGEKSEVTWTFHYPLSTYSEALYKAGFQIVKIEEWVSNKISVGKHANIENKSRAEFPLFIAILAKKLF